MTKTSNAADNLIAQIILGVEEVKGLDIKLLDLRPLDNTVCDYFVVCSGTSNTRLLAMCN